MGRSVSMDGYEKSHPTVIPPPDRPRRSESLYRLNYSGPLTDGDAVNNSKVSRGLSAGSGLHRQSQSLLKVQV